MRSEALRNLIRKPRIMIAISHHGGGMEHGGSPDFGGHDGGYGDSGGHDMGHDGGDHPGAKDEMLMRQDAHDQVMSGLEQLAETYPAMKKLQRQFEGAYAKAVSGKGAGRKPRVPKEKPPVEAEADAPPDDTPAD